MSHREAIILVGGLGTRLSAVVPDVPKPMAPVAGRPFLDRLIERLAARGIGRIVLATGYKAEIIMEYFGFEQYGVEIDYSIEREPLGTGGAIALALQKVRASEVHVLNGDTFLDYDPDALAAATHAHACAIGIALAEVADVSRYGAVAVDRGRVSKMSEKGERGLGWINAGCYFFAAAAIADFPRSGRFSFETDVLPSLVAEGKAAAWQETSGFIDIGVPEDYARVQTHVPLFG